MSEGKRRSKSDLDDLRIVYQLEREIRCNADPTANVVVSAYTLFVLFNRLAVAEGRSPGVATDPADECDGSGIVWRQAFYDDGSPSRDVSEWPCLGCDRCCPETLETVK